LCLLLYYMLVEEIQVDKKYTTVEFSWGIIVDILYTPCVNGCSTKIAQTNKWVRIYHKAKCGISYAIKSGPNYFVIMIDMYYGVWLAG